METVTRRAFVTAAAAACLPTGMTRALGHPTRATAPADHHVMNAPMTRVDWRFFDAQEAALVTALCDRLIPADGYGRGGALAAGVPGYIDVELSGSWGSGLSPHRCSSWQPGNAHAVPARRARHPLALGASPPPLARSPTPPSQSPLPLVPSPPLALGSRSRSPSPPSLLPSHSPPLSPSSPAQIFRTALRSIDRISSDLGSHFGAMPFTAQHVFLTGLQADAFDLDGVSSARFFDMLLQMTVEQYFSHPVHGATRDRIAWRLPGFAGSTALVLRSGHMT